MLHSHEFTFEELDVATALEQARLMPNVEQTRSGADQEASDDDLRASLADQELSDRDQLASDRDQAASDYDHRFLPASPASEHAHRVSTAQREVATAERAAATEARARVAGHRLLTAVRRDHQARLRDRAANARDCAAEAQDRAAEAGDRAWKATEQAALASGLPSEIVDALRAMRLEGAAARERAAADRRSAAGERLAAARDRDRAAEDRTRAALDALTDVVPRRTGERVLSHEISRARRSRQPLVLARIDVAGLNANNAAQGPGAGDTLLRIVARAITSTMRAYDVTVRWDADEFICLLSNTTTEIATTRVRSIQSALESLHSGASISAGLAELEAHDTPDSLLARAGEGLLRLRL